MTKYTVNLSLPYPENSDRVAVDSDVRALAIKADAEIKTVDVHADNRLTILENKTQSLDRALYMDIGKNLYNHATDAVDMFLGAPGTPVSLANFRLSDFIPVHEGQEYTINAARSIAQYDAQHTLLDDTYINTGTQGVQTFTAQADGFIRFSYNYNITNPRAVQVERGTRVTSYEPYSQVLDLTGLNIIGFSPDAARKPVTVTRNGDSLSIQTMHDNALLQIRVSLREHRNGVFNFIDTSIDGNNIHVTGDSVAPIRSNQLTIGANHGFLGCATWAAGAHDKTTDDIGSLWDHAGETVTLLHVDSDGRAWVGRQPTLAATGEYNLRTLSLTADITHVSGATHTSPLIQASADPTTRQLAPAVKNVQSTVTLNGRPMGNETRAGDALTIRESYEILDLAGIHEAVQDTPGVPFPELHVRSAVLVEHEYRFTTGGVCHTWGAITELAPTRLLHCGFVQAETLTLPATRYAPGVAVKNGIDWPHGVPMEEYATDQNITTDDLLHPGAPPVMALDVRDDVAFAIGLHPWKAGASQAVRRLEAAPTQLWDMRGSRKSYPVVTTGEAPGWGRLEAHGIRAYLTPAQAQKIIDSGDSAYAAWAALETQTKLS